jgi:hypothetical protein
VSKKFKNIVEDAIKTAQPKTGDVTAQKAQRQKSQTDRMSAKKASDSLPKNNGDVFASKPEPNRGPGADRKPTVPRNHNTRPTMESIKEDAPAMAAGAAGDPGAVQNPTSNYAAQRDLAKKKKPLKTFMARRKKPVGEEFEAGIGNTQIKKNTKVEKKSSGKKKVSSPPGNGGSNDAGMPIGGMQ